MWGRYLLVSQVSIFTLQFNLAGRVPSCVLSAGASRLPTLDLVSDECFLSNFASKVQGRLREPCSQASTCGTLENAYISGLRFHFSGFRFPTPPQVLTSGPSSSIEILTTSIHHSSHSHHVVETSTAPLHPGCSSLAGLRLADSLLRCRQRDRQTSRRPLRPRWHLCHCLGTSPRRFLPMRK